MENFGELEGSPLDDTTHLSPKKDRWGLTQRLEFIDFRLCWEGKLNRSDLMSFFGISVPLASQDLSRYKEIASNNIRYDYGEKVYLKTENFDPVYKSSDSTRYLNDLLAVHEGLLPIESSFIVSPPPLGTVPHLARIVSPPILYAVVSAIRIKTTIEIEYLSFSSPNPSIRKISPHSLSYDGFRWHTRAFCHRRKEFRDFVLARIFRVISTEPSEIDAKDDLQWNNIVTLILAPNPKLSESHQKATAFDYGMADGEYRLPCRQALLFYALGRLGLLPHPREAQISQRLVLLNHDEIMPLVSFDESAVTQPGAKAEG